MRHYKRTTIKSNEQLEIIFILRGQGTLLIAKLDGYYELNKTDIFVVNSYEPRDIIMEENALALGLHIIIKISRFLFILIEENIPLINGFCNFTVKIISLSQ